jgi:AcrR family transcriptional regulator
MAPAKTKPRARTYTISLANRKPRGSGHERLAEILAAAKELFLEQGVENVTTRKIAERVGISQTALFSYYSSKDKILARLIQDAFAELGRMVAGLGAEAADTRDWFRRCVAGYVRFGLKYPNEYRLAFMVMRPWQGAFGFPLFLELEKRVAAAMEEGVLRRDLGSSRLVAQTLWASMHGLTSLLIARPRPRFPWEDVEDLVRTQTEMLLTGLLAER